MVKVTLIESKITYLHNNITIIIHLVKSTIKLKRRIEAKQTEGSQMLFYV